MSRADYCCGKCPPIEGGGYDCTCLYVKNCPKRKDMTMLENLRWRIQIWWGDILAWNWKRKRRKRKQWNIEGSDD